MEEFNFYPEKPELKQSKPKSNMSRTVFSIVLFVVSFMLFFSEQLSFVLYLLIVLIIHELGHFGMMKLFKYENVKLLFVPLMGAFVQGKKDLYSQRESFYVVIAGPIPGVIIGSLLVHFGVQSKVDLMTELGLLFMFLNLVNLLPIDPLDGGQIVRLFVKSRYEFFQLLFSFISSLVLIMIGVYLGEYIITIFGFLMAFRVRSIQKNYLIHKELKKEGVNYVISYKDLTNKDYAKIKQSLIATSPSLKMYMDQLPEEETNPLFASQVNGVLVTPVMRDASILFKLIIFLVWLSAFVLPAFLLLNDLKTFINGL